MQALALVLVSRCSIRDFLALPSSRLDLDSNGKLDARELEAAVAKLCEDGDISLATAQNYNNIIGRFDSNGSGDLDYEEFEQMIKKMLRIPHSRVMLRSTSIPQPQRYTTKSMWLSTLRNFPQSEVLRGIAQPLFAVVAVGLAVALVASLPSLSTWTRPRYELAKSLAQMHSLLGGALSLLLVFRTNAAYNRFWEARRIWESITNRCRDLARFGFVYRRSLRTLHSSSAPTPSHSAATLRAARVGTPRSSRRRCRRCRRRWCARSAAPRIGRSTCANGSRTRSGRSPKAPPSLLVRDSPRNRSSTSSHRMWARVSA